MGFEINDLFISGNLTRDPELATLGSSQVCEFDIAHNERFKGSDGQWTSRPNFFTVKLWAAQGERFAREGHKGMHVTIHGRLSQRTWEDRETGGKRSKIEIVAEDMVYNSRQSESQGHQHDEYGYPRDPDGSPTPKPRDDYRDVDFGEDELPF